MPSWPSDIPFFDAYNGASRSAPGGQLRSEMSVGPAKVRRRTSSNPQTREGSTVPITLAQLDMLEGFFSFDLAEGALAFDYVDPFDGKARSFRFLGGYDVARAGEFFVVSATLEVLP